MIEIALPHGPDPFVVLSSARANGVSAIAAGASFITRENDYLLTVPDTHEAAVLDTIAAAPTAMPVIVPETVSETQFMRASVKVGMVTAEEAEAYLARGELPGFVNAALALLPEDQRVDARLKAVGAANFSRSDSVFAALVAGGAATAKQVDQLFILADTLG